MQPIRSDGSDVPTGSIPHWIDPVRKADLVARRRTVHRTPETGWAEFIATARAAEFFTSLGFKVMVGREFIDPILRARPLRQPR